MSDIAFLAASVVFFVVAVLYVARLPATDERRGRQCLKMSFCCC